MFLPFKKDGLHNHLSEERQFSLSTSKYVFSFYKQSKLKLCLNLQKMIFWGVAINDLINICSPMDALSSPPPPHPTKRVVCSSVVDFVPPSHPTKRVVCSSVVDLCPPPHPTKRVVCSSVVDLVPPPHPTKRVVCSSVVDLCIRYTCPRLKVGRGGGG